MRHCVMTPLVLFSVAFAVAMTGCRRADRSAPSAPSAPAVAAPADSPDTWQLDPPASVGPEIAKLYEEKNVGAQLFQHYCTACHGPRGKGDGIYYSDGLAAKPTDLTDKSMAEVWTDDHIAKVIRDGSAAVGKSALCPPWSRVFSDEQVSAVVQHVRQLPNALAEP